jgi:hypothetical protein
MDSKKLKQVVNQLKKQLISFEVEKLIKHSNDETQTRDNLIHPFLNILNYEKIEDYTHEFVADLKDKKGKKVDIAITLGKEKTPIILIECKRANQSLNDNHYRQLREYCTDTPSAKVGILTNGIEYKFYIKQNNSVLYDTPFFVFNLLEYDSSDLDLLAMFYKQTLEVNDIIEEAEEIHFIEKFDEGFYNTFANPSDDLVKIIFKNMGGKRTSERINLQIKDLVNSISIRNTLDKILKKEASESNTGIYTTEEEIKAYNVIKTIMAMFKNTYLDRIGYRDLKGSFLVLVDDNQKKRICSLILKENSKSIEIEGKKHSLEDTSIASFTKLKKQLVESALKCV